jgi:hypothetical protein
MEIEGEILGLVLLFLVISAGFYFFIIRDNSDPGEEVILPGQEEIVSVGDQSGENLTDENLTQENETVVNVSFGSVEELHWDHMPLTYRIVNNASKCEGIPIIKMKEAFEIISRASEYRINFTEARENQTADINITCVDLPSLLVEMKDDEKCEEVDLDYRSVQFSGYEVLTEDDYVTSLDIVARNDTTNTYKLCYVNKNAASVSFDWALLGEAKPEIKDGIVVGAKKTIYTIDSEYSYCTNFPAKEVHDVMHILGFVHTETPVFDDYYGWFFKDLRYFKDMMFPYPYCAYITELNQNYADCLKYIYSDGTVGEGCLAVNFAA